MPMGMPSPVVNEPLTTIIGGGGQIRHCMPGKTMTKATSILIRQDVEINILGK